MRMTMKDCNCCCCSLHLPTQKHCEQGEWKAFLCWAELDVWIVAQSTPQPLNVIVRRMDLKVNDTPQMEA